MLSPLDYKKDYNLRLLAPSCAFLRLLAPSCAFLRLRVPWRADVVPAHTVSCRPELSYQTTLIDLSVRRSNGTWAW
jgi:hypothetical protein